MSEQWSAGHPTWAEVKASKGAGDLPNPRRMMLDGSPCWCVSAADPHEGWTHAPLCEQLRSRTLPLIAVDLASGEDRTIMVAIGSIDFGRGRLSADGQSVTYPLRTKVRVLCTGWSAQWCPNHGTCRCTPAADVDGRPPGLMVHDGCALHDVGSEHAANPALTEP